MFSGSVLEISKCQLVPGLLFLHQTYIASSPVLSVAAAQIEVEDYTESTSYEKEIELSGSSDNIPIVDLAGTLIAFFTHTYASSEKIQHCLTDQIRA